MSLDPRLRTGLLASGAIVTAALLIAAVLAVPGGSPPARLRIGVLPDESAAILQDQFTPLLTYLSDEIGLPCDLVIPESYAALVRRFADGDIDMGYFGGLTFVQAEARARAVPLVIRDADLSTHSYFLTRTESTATSLGDLKGARFTFGDRLSTSGHLMPRFFMQRDGLRPEEWFSEVRYSGAHDTTAYWVRDDEVDVGVANAGIIDSMFADGRLDRGGVRILMRTPSYADHVWAVRPDMPDALRTRVRDAFLALTPREPEEAAILQLLGAGSFLPALSTDFFRLREITTELSLLDQISP